VSVLKKKEGQPVKTGNYTTYMQNTNIWNITEARKIQDVPVC